MRSVIYIVKFWVKGKYGNSFLEVVIDAENEADAVKEAFRGMKGIFYNWKVVAV
tara:strand:+ start:452 stop:613 length:162 start_codon:yes stop_codon:yes gene_type:complete